MSSLIGVDDVAIVGGGLAGLALAIGLSHRNFQVSVYEKCPTFLPIGTTLGIAPNGWKALREIQYGLDDRVANVGAPIRSFLNGSTFKALDETEVAEAAAKSSQMKDELTEKYGRGILLHPWWAVRDTLIEALPPSVSVYNGEELSHLEDPPGSEYASLHFKSGRVVKARLVIGADGVHSVTRQLLGGCPSENTGSKTWRGWGHIKDAPKWLQLGPGTSYFVYGKNQFFATFELPEGRFTWTAGDSSEATAKAAAEDSEQAADGNDDYDPSRSISTKGEEVDMDEFRKVFSEMLTPEMEDVIAASNRESFLQSYSHVVPMPAEGAHGWGGRGRVTLLGDAAHAMRPVSGQGANQAFEDCVALVRELTGELPILPLSSKTGGNRVDLTDFSDVDERLRKFEATRLPRVRAIHADQKERVSSFSN
jgi:salicylate hydroxylase